jgi:Fe2+ or Zn2+ uptake regulation protein
MENTTVEQRHFVELDEESMILINTCEACERVITTSLEHVAVFESVKCRGCGKINSFPRHHIERAKEIISRFE